MLIGYIQSNEPLPHLTEGEPGGLGLLSLRAPPCMQGLHITTKKHLGYIKRPLMK